MAGLRGDEDFEVRYQCTDCTPSSGMHIFSANDSEQVTADWLISGTGGENITWYWDPGYTQRVILGEDVRTEYVAFQSGKTLVFGLYGRVEKMDIKLKMGAKADLPSSKNNGTVYFAKDGDKNFGELYYDDENGNRVKVGGTSITSVEFCPEHQGVLDGIYWKHFLRVTNEDGTYIDSNILPRADFTSEGVMSFANSLDEIQQMPVGIKSFYPGILIGTAPAMDINHGYAIGMGDAAIFFGDDSTLFNKTGLIYSPEALVLAGGLESDAGIIMAMGFDESSMSPIFSVSPSDQGMGFAYHYGYFLTDSLGAEDDYIPAAFIEEITADSIHSTMFTGAFTGDLEGNAKTATSWYAPIILNDTEVKGGETAAITTAKWGAARNFSISDSAGTTGTSIDGSSEDGYTLVIPSTMTGFTSITSTNLLATNLGATGTPVMTSHFKEVYLHNPNNNNYMHKLTSNAGSATCDLQLPNTSGLLLSKPTTNTTVGDTNSPVYIAASGEATVCTTIAVDHGGTGLNTVAAGSLVYGNGINAMGTIAADAKGKLLGSNGASAAPIYLTPSLSFTTGTSNPKVKLTINGVDYETSTGIQAASSTNPGIVSVGTQTFNGAKTFSEAATFSKGLSSTTGTFSGQINAGADIKLKGNLKSDSSGTSFVTLTDTRATITSPALHLNGTILVLNSSTYGTSLPNTGLEEGRVFFLLT